MYNSLSQELNSIQTLIFPPYFLPLMQDITVLCPSKAFLYTV